MSDAKEEKEGEHKEAAPKSKKKLIIIIAVALVVLLGGGAGAFLLLGKKAAEHREGEEDAEAPRVLKLAKLDPFIVNLSDQKIFLKVVMSVEYDDEIMKKIAAGTGAAAGEGGGHGAGGGAGGGGAPVDPFAVPAPMIEKEPKLRDAVIRIMSAKKLQDVLTGEGKKQLGDELVEALNTTMGYEEPAITAVYFLEFLAQ